MEIMSSNESGDNHSDQYVRRALSTQIQTSENVSNPLAVKLAAKIGYWKGQSLSRLRPHLQPENISPIQVIEVAEHRSSVPVMAFVSA